MIGMSSSLYKGGSTENLGTFVTNLIGMSSSLYKGDFTENFGTFVTNLIEMVKLTIQR